VRGGRAPDADRLAPVNGDDTDGDDDTALLPGGVEAGAYTSPLFSST